MYLLRKISVFLRCLGVLAIIVTASACGHGVTLDRYEAEEEIPDGESILGQGDSTGGSSNHIGTHTVRTSIGNYDMIVSTGQTVSIGSLQSDIGVYEIENTLTF